MTQKKYSFIFFLSVWVHRRVVGLNLIVIGVWHTLYVIVVPRKINGQNKNRIETTLHPSLARCDAFAHHQLIMTLLLILHIFFFACRKKIVLWANDLVECCVVHRVIVSHRAAFIFDQKLWAFIGIIIADAAHLWTFTSVWWIRITWTVWIGTTAATTTWARAITFAVFAACRICMICCIRHNRSIIVCVWRFMMWSMMIMMSTVSTSDIGHLTSQFCENRKRKNSKDTKRKN